MVRLSRWFVVFELDSLRSLIILVYNNERSVLLGVDMRIGKRVVRRLVESMTSFLRRRTRLPTIFSRSSLSRVAWCWFKSSLRWSGYGAVSSG